MRGHVGNRSPVLRAPETLPSGRAAVSLFWPKQYYFCKQEALCAELSSEAGRCTLIMQRSGGLWGVVQQHGVALHGQLGISDDPMCIETEGGRQAGAGRYGS